MIPFFSDQISQSPLSLAGTKGGKAPKHSWTEEERAIVRRDYRGTNRSAEDIAHKLGVSFNSVKGQVQEMGIAMQKSPPWTAAELETLNDLVHIYSVRQIAKRLHRSENAVKIKANRLKLGLRSRDDWYTKNEVCEILGVDHRRVQSWIHSGAIVATWHNGHKPQQKGMAMWHITTKALKDFLLVYSGELLGRNVDIQQIIWLVAKE